MHLTSDSLNQGRVEGAPLPVILPLPSRTDRERAERRGEGEKRPSGGRRSDVCADVERFTFPALPEPKPDMPLSEAVKAMWPACGDTETCRACAAIAEAIIQQLTSHRSTVVAITSPGDGDGKTSLLISLAPQLAKRVTTSVLVLDTHFHKPDLTARLKLPPSGSASSTATIYPTQLPRLHVLPAAARPAKAAWFEDLRETWPLVLLDLPSLAHPEAAALASFCDCAYLVVRLGHTGRRAVADAARLIRDAGGRLLGSIVVG
jgi:Mrp family chromosome partitioning ATPase